VAWVKNDFAILADTQDYNFREFKKYENKIKKQQLL
jgi:hypothetical protein